MNKSVSIIMAENILKNVEGASADSIEFAEEKLKVRFSDEYKEFLANLGACVFREHEIVGICQYKNMDVIEATLEAREFNPAVPSDLYVIENTHFDSIYIWQDQSGIVYQTYPNCKPEKIASSLLEYLEL